MTCALLAFAPARALADVGRTIAVDVVSADGCIDPAAFLAELAQRLPTDVTLGAGPKTRHAAVHLRRADVGFVGELSWEGEPPRPFQAEQCDTVARAILLSISLSATPPAPLPEVTPPPAPAASTSPPAPPPPPPKRADVKPPPPPDDDAHWRVTYGVVGRFFGAAGPANVALGGTIEAGLTRPGVLQPSVRFTLTRSFESFPDSLPTARIRTTLARIDICPIRFATDRAYATPCLGLDAGNLSFMAPDATDESFWLAPVVLARGGVEIVAPLGLEAAAGIEIPLTPARFAYTDEIGFRDQAYASFDVGLLLETSLVLTFP